MSLGPVARPAAAPGHRERRCRRGQYVTDQKFGSVEEYIGSFPAEVQPILERVRRAILGAVPGAGETISYGIPTITLGGRPLLYFAGWKRHISLYPAPAGDEALERRLGPYRSAKSTLKFPLSRPVPYDLIAQVAKLSLQQRQDGSGG
jgi:uncharacterized protein YdhG (YjbR/CyaY superfamily)